MDELSGFLKDFEFGMSLDTFSGDIGPYPCPKCGSKTRLVARKHGIFWGCVDYPQCDGTINYQE